VSSPYDEFKGILLYEEISLVRWKELKQQYKLTSRKEIKRFVEDRDQHFEVDDFNMDTVYPEWEAPYHYF